MSDLAIVIPAYKGKYFSQVLECLAAQSDHRFTVYIGDDAGEPAIREACETFREQLNIVYKRFDTNLGGEDLVGHWCRCVALSSEPWVWLFSDDDRCSPDTVSSFYETRERHPDYDLYRWPVAVIDEENAVIKESEPGYGRELGVEYLLSRMTGKRESFVVEYVFARKAYDREGGFVNFPHAWFSDDASWMAFARNTGMCGIVGGQVHWRLSGQNISGSMKPSLTREKVGSLLRFHGWLLDYLAEPGVASADIKQAVCESIPDWLWRQLGGTGLYRYPAVAMAEASKIAPVAGMSTLRTRVVLLYKIICANIQWRIGGQNN